MKPLHIRPLAAADIDAAVDYLLEENVQAAQRFLDATESAFALLAQRPGLGSQRFAQLLPGVQIRSWPLSGHPYLVFYLETKRGTEVIRLLHTRRDIPAILADDDSNP